MFCFHHAGGSAAAFRLWPAGLPDGLEVCAVQLPGRANRLGEPPLSSIEAMVDAVIDALAPSMDLPFALFGHSMGAVLAFEVACALAGRTMTAPRHLFLSGRRPPGMPSPDPDIRHLPDDDFLAELGRRYAAVPQEILQHRDVLELVLPALRADIAALETFPVMTPAPLDGPLTVFGGLRDRLTPLAHLEAWRALTTGAFRLRLFPGDHFYLEPQRDALLADIAATLRPMLSDPVEGPAGAEADA